MDRGVGVASAGDPWLAGNALATLATAGGMLVAVETVVASCAGFFAGEPCRCTLAPARLASDRDAAVFGGLLAAAAGVTDACGESDACGDDDACGDGVACGDRRACGDGFTRVDSAARDFAFLGLTIRPAVAGAVATASRSAARNDVDVGGCPSSCPVGAGRPVGWRNANAATALASTPAPTIPASMRPRGRGRGVAGAGDDPACGASRGTASLGTAAAAATGLSAEAWAGAATFSAGATASAGATVSAAGTTALGGGSAGGGITAGCAATIGGCGGAAAGAGGAAPRSTGWR